MESERRAVSAAHVSRVVRPGRHLASCSPRPSYVAKLPSGKVMRPAGLPTALGAVPLPAAGSWENDSFRGTQGVGYRLHLARRLYFASSDGRASSSAIFPLASKLRK